MLVGGGGPPSDMLRMRDNRGELDLRREQSKGATDRNRVEQGAESADLLVIQT